MRIWVVLLILVAGICTKSMADDGEEDRCHNDHQCIHHECDSDETPYCSHFRCHCRDKPYCQRHSDCSSCSGHVVGYCNRDHHYCSCSGSVHCSHDNDCDQYMCSSNMYPTCSTVYSHHRCVCTHQPVKHPATTQTAVKPYCQHHSDCSNCSSQLVGYCSRNNHVCGCSESIFCKNENDCDHFTCASNMYPTCRIVHGHHRCICAPSTQTAGTQITNCKQQSDCANYVCLNDRPIPYCRHDVVFVFDLGHHCHCTGCLEDKDCTCPAGTASHCDHYYSHGPGSCHCTPIITSTSTDAPISTDGTTTPAPTTRRTTTRAPTTSVVSTTTSVPASVSPLSTRGCHNHSDCSGHICPSEKHPYCKIDRYSSTCHCTDCTEHKHCFCPQGLVGQCHFDYMHNSHSCVCGLIPDTTTIVPTTTTKSPSVPTMSTTTKSTSIPTTTTTPQSSSTQPTTITSTLPSTSTPKSTTRVASTASSTVDSSSNTPTSITPTAFSSTKSGIRKCHTCGDANNSISCDTRTIYLGNLQSCAPGEDFCMTDVIHDGHAYPKTYKRCVTEQECRNKWLHQSSDLEYCINYGSVPMSGQYSCHFCCVTDGCNAGQVPDKSTYYTKA